MGEPTIQTRSLPQSTTGGDNAGSGARGTGVVPSVVGQQNANPPGVAGTDAEKAAAAARRAAALDVIVQANLDRLATFMGVPILNGVHKDLVRLLKQVEADLHFAPGVGTHGITGIIGYRPPGNGPHSYGVAIDIDAAKNPYVIHEAGEQAYDAELAKTYDRIALFIIGFSSIIPKLGGSSGAAADRDTVYTRLEEESDAMKKYFQMMIHQKDLRDYLATANGQMLFGRVSWDFSSLKGFDVPHPSDPKDPKTLDAVTKIMQADFVLLKWADGPPIDPVPIAGTGGAPDTVRPSSLFPYPKPKGFKSTGKTPVDAVFKNGSPLDGFLALTFDIVKGLTDRGFRWGAGTMFGAESGDIMHFDYQPLKAALNRQLDAQNP